MSHLAIAMLAIMVICEAEDETADMTFAGLLRGAEKTSSRIQEGSQSESSLWWLS